MKKERAENGIIQERKKRILSIRTLFLFLLSAAIVAFLLNKLDLKGAITLIRQSNPRLIILAVFIYFSVNFFKTLRYGVILGKGNLITLFTVSGYHNFFNMILPARTGELTFVYYAKKIAGIDIARGLHTLLVARIFDFIVISAIFLTSVLVYYGADATPLLLGLGIVFFIISVLIMVNLKYFVVVLNAAVSYAFRKTGVAEKKWPARILDKISLLIKEFEGFDARRVLPMLTITSLLTWGALYSLFYVTVLAFGVQIDFIRSVIGSTGGVLTNVLPINSFGSFGTLEAGWTGGFILVGLSHQEAIVTGFGSHIIDFAASALLALLCLGFSKIFTTGRSALPSDKPEI